MPRHDPLRRLVEAALEGDDAALAELVARTQAPLRRLFAVLGSPGVEEDLVQDTWERALRALPTYRGEASVLVWLVSIARRVCADDVRRRQRQRRLLGRLVAAGRETSLTQPAPIDDLIRALDPNRRDAFVLTQLVGLSYDEAAAALSCPVGTIRSRVARARTDLIGLVRRAEAQ